MPCTTAFVCLGTFQVVAICVITVAAIALSYLLGLDEGRIRGRRQEREKAAQNRYQGLWFPGRHS